MIMKKIIFLFIAMVTLQMATHAADPTRDLIKAAGDATVYPNDNLVVVYDSTLVDVKESGLSYVTTHTLTKVLNTKGALEMSVVKFGYDPLSAFVDIKKVVIYKKDGTTKELDVSQVMDYPAPARAIYWGSREKMICIGRLLPGDAMEVVEFKKGFTYALLAGEDDDAKYIPPMKGHFYDIVEFWNTSPVKVKCYQVKVPKTKPVQYEVYNGEIQSSVVFHNDKTIYTFTRRDFIPFKSENRMVALSDVAPKLLLSTSPDWFAKSTWFNKVNEDFGSFTVTPEIKTKTSEILRGSQNELDSISRLTHWVADEIRYSGISMGCGEGYTLHKGQMTFTDRCGVCKDKAGMLITMLRAAGFKAYPAMTMAGSRIDYIPADQFNHSVTVVKLKDRKYHLLDPTWVPFVRELWSSAEQQQQYLAGVPEGADLGTTPVSAPENHYIRINTKSELSPDGTLTGSVVLTAEGQSDASIRGIFKNYGKTQWSANVEKELLKVSSFAEVTNIEFGDPIDYQSGPIKIKVDFRIPEFARISGDKVLFTPLSAEVFRTFQPQLAFETATADKKYAFRDRCSRQVEIDETMTLPAQSSVSFMPESKHKPGSVCSFDGGLTLNGNVLHLKEKISLGKRIYDAKDWPGFRDAVNAQESFVDNHVVFEKK